ncbi:MAG: hypothetical protein JNL60_06000 [Bacteroidia bacterium]|nr:hypothetical protein [Bacteroidia bacterium]
MATYGCLLLFFGMENTIYDYLTTLDSKWRISLVVFLFSFAFPVLNIFILVKLKRVPGLTLSNQKDRTFPYLITSLFYFGLYYLFMDTTVWPSIKLFIIGGGLAILLTALINLRYKISAHMVGIGGLLGGVISVASLIDFNMTVYYIVIVIVAGLVGFARLELEEHKPSQIYSGFLLGIFVQTFLFFTLQGISFA